MRNTRVIRGRNPVRQVMTWLVCGVWLAWAGVSAQAATINWSSTTGGDYTNGANWTGGVAPGPSDSASIALTNTFTINLTAPVVTNTTLYVDGNPATQTFNLNGNTLFLASGGMGYRQGGAVSATTNTMTFLNGTILSPTNTVMYLAAAGYIGGKSSIATLNFSNIILNAKTWGAGNGSDGAYVGNGYWNMYCSTATVATLSLAVSGGASTPGTGNILVANGSLLTVSNAISVGQYGDASGLCGNITVSNATMSVLGGMTLGQGAGGQPVNGHLNIVAGSTVVVSNGLTIGSLSPSWGTLFIDGTNSVLDLASTGSGCSLDSRGAITSTVTIANGTLKMSNGWFSVGQSGGAKGAVVMTGGLFQEYGTTRTLIAHNAANQTGTVWLVGPDNPTFNAQDWVQVGDGGNGCNGTIGVSNGIFHAANRAWIGGTGGQGQLIVANGGTFQCDGALTIGGSGATGTVSVVTGGILDLSSAGTLTVQAQGGGVMAWVTNNGGVFQFANASPTITPGTFGNVVISNGTVSFRGITTADVTCNQGTKALRSDTVMFWAGTNTFRLNSATNSGTIDQTYTFAPGTATNFARLELVNGSTYRNGRVTIGANGSLYLSGGASTISSVLTAAPSSTLEFNLANTNAPACLLSTTNVYLNNCTLQLDLANPPILNTQFMIISNSLASQLSYSFAGGNTKQNFTINGTNYLTTISLTGGGTKVVVQTTIPVRGTTAFFR